MNQLKHLKYQTYFKNTEKINLFLNKTQYNKHK